MTSFGIRGRRDTPELVPVELALAGPLSRGCAAGIDALPAAMVGLWLSRTTSLGGDAALLVGLVVVVVTTTFCEVWSGGSSPGKAAVGLRVVAADGGPTSAGALAVRNLARPVDLLPGPYGIGLAAILVTRSSQRVGDRAAGTIVIVDPVHRLRRASPASALHGRPSIQGPAPAPPGQVRPPAASGPGQPPPDPDLVDLWAEVQSAHVDLPSWDVHGLNRADLAVAHRFLDRRHRLAPAMRQSYAVALADHLVARTPGAPSNWPPESVIELIVRIAADR